MSITLFTAACDRPEAWALCERWMARQTVKADQWLVIDDDRIRPTKCTMGQEYHLIPESNPQQSMPAKARYIFDHNLVRGDVLLFIENDDWYAPNYIESMIAQLQHVALVGEGRAVYYHVRWRALWRHNNLGHASLCSTAIARAGYAHLHSIIKQMPDNPFFDCVLWPSFPLSKRVLGAEQGHTVVGMKCMPGITGSVGQHRNREHGIQADTDLSKLRELIGSDADAYAPFYNPDWTREPDPPPPYSVDSNGQQIGLGGE